MNRLTGGNDESCTMDLQGLQNTEMNEDDKADESVNEAEAEDEVEDGDGDDDEETLADSRLDEENEVVADGTNVIDERRVITSQGSETEIDLVGNLNERLIGCGNGYFCGEFGCQKDSGIERPMVRQKESARGGIFMVCRGGEKHTVKRYGMRAFAKWMLRIGQHRWRTTANEQDDVCGQGLVRMGVG